MIGKKLQHVRPKLPFLFVRYSYLRYAIMTNADYADVSKRGLAGSNFLSENPVTQSLENLIIICRGEYS